MNALIIHPSGTITLVTEASRRVRLETKFPNGARRSWTVSHRAFGLILADAQRDGATIQEVAE